MMEEHKSFHPAAMVESRRPVDVVTGASEGEILGASEVYGGVAVGACDVEGGAKPWREWE